jgi:hypothetical protein
MHREIAIVFMMLNIPIVKMKVEKEVIRIFLNRNPKWRTDNIKIGKEFFKIPLKVLKVFLAGRWFPHISQR